jgi:DNA mismatch endonuclease (patch repair protein)
VRLPTRKGYLPVSLAVSLDPPSSSPGRQRSAKNAGMTSTSSICRIVRRTPSSYMAPATLADVAPLMPPAASSDAVRAVMKGNRGTDTRPEIAVRALLHRQGFRFFKHRRPMAGLRCVADIVFPSFKVAVFVDGCFWHRCPEHGTRPAANRAYWDQKLDRNVARDRRNDEALTRAGWVVIRAWEHEAVNVTVARVADALATRRYSPKAPRQEVS